MLMVGIQHFLSEKKLSQGILEFNRGPPIQRPTQRMNLLLTKLVGHCENITGGLPISATYSRPYVAPSLEFALAQ